jgi:hypothetical protein
MATATMNTGIAGQVMVHHMKGHEGDRVSENQQAEKCDMF